MMRHTFLLLSASVLLLFSVSVPAAQVEGLQSPAWVERDNQKLPLRPGMTMGEYDVIETGPGGRLLLVLADGSLLKLGEQARLSLSSLQENSSGGTLKGLFKVARGAFRYTAAALGWSRQREIDLQLATTTIGIRGTDVWGRNENGTATVCLIEGRVNVYHPIRGEFVMDQPLSFFIVPREGEAHPVAPIDPDKLKRWAAETELDLGRGVLVPGGAWIVQLGSHSREADARQAEKMMRESGWPVDVTTVQLKSQTFYRLRVSGFDTQQDARAFADKVKGRPGIGTPWVTCSIPGQPCE